MDYAVSHGHGMASDLNLQLGSKEDIGGVLKQILFRDSLDEMLSIREKCCVWDCFGVFLRSYSDSYVV